MPNGVENWTENLNKIVLKTKSKSEWGNKLKFWMTLVDMREELYEDVGLGHLRGEQGRGDTRIGPGKGDNFEIINQNGSGFSYFIHIKNQQTAPA